MFIATVIVGCVLAAVFLAAGIPKVLGERRAAATAVQLKIALPTYRVVGFLEILGAVGMLAGLTVHGIGVVAAIGLALMMVAAVVTLVRVGQPLRMIIPALVCAALAVSYVVLRILSA